jgi:serine/threonine-protein kinase
MTDDPRVQQLLEELLDSQATPEEVCASCPELLPVVRDRWRQMGRVLAGLDALFPPPPDLPSTHLNAPPPPPPEPPPPPPEGTALPRIPGYEVEGVLGRGGMGIVYRARHLRLKRLVALKMSLACADCEPRERERLQREAEAVAGLRHENIVRVYDVGDHDGRPYFTMEFVEGGSLAQKLAGTPQPARPAAALVATLAEAVQVAHQGGVVHRDLKPANILLTADGTPKISDFGVARRLGAGASLTQTGTAVGTPSYMAPELVRGKTDVVGPAVDVYALGAILYELLTGRPPFRAATAAETVYQLAFQDPVPPSRLNFQVPRDLETICLKCLQKAPQHRYASARALADDLRRFGEGRPIQARPLGWGGRLWRWGRRHPAAAALAAASLPLVMALAGGGLWLERQRAQRRQAVEADLKEVAERQEQARWTAARAALERGEARLGGGGPGDLRRLLAQARHDLDLVVQLDAIHLKRVSRVEEEDFYNAPADADRDYEAAFRDAGLGQVHDDPAGVAARVRGSAVRGALVAALDDWTVSVTDRDRRRWLLEVARRADPDPEGWRDRARDPRAWEDGAALAELAETAPVAGPEVQLLLALGERWRAGGGDATGFLRRVQREHPADFWANFMLGNALKYRGSGEAISYFRVALAIRPEAAIASSDLGDVLKFQGWLDEALHYYRKALAIDPGNTRAQTAFGNLLKDMGRTDEALAYFRQAVRDDPGNVGARFNLGKALKLTGRLDEAADHYRQALGLDAKNPAAHDGLRSVLIRQGRGEQVRVAWRKVLDTDPPEHEAWLGYAELCLFLGHEEEYRRARRALLARFGASTDPFLAERIGSACLLVPAPEDELRQAAALLDRAVAAGRSKPDWAYAYFLFGKGLAEYRRGRLESAIALLQGEAAFVPGPGPRLVLAMAQHRQGRKEEARHTLAAAAVAFDWGAAQADNPEAWTCHVLRREAEALILPNLPAFLDGKHQPQDNDERLALLGACQFANRTRAMARLYADAFAAAPALADDLGAGHRYNAARAAALAGCGHGADAPGLGEGEGKRWRDQARQWLRAELAARARALDADPTAARWGVREALTRWRKEPDLACVRDPAELDRLAADERKEYLALWADVAAVLARTEK